jgi:hypothetical protein
VVRDGKRLLTTLQRSAWHEHFTLALGAWAPCWHLYIKPLLRRFIAIHQYHQLRNSFLTSRSTQPTSPTPTPTQISTKMVRISAIATTLARTSSPIPSLSPYPFRPNQTTSRPHRSRRSPASKLWRPGHRRVRLRFQRPVSFLPLRQRHLRTPEYLGR